MHLYTKTYSKSLQIFIDTLNFSMTVYFLFSILAFSLIGFSCVLCAVATCILQANTLFSPEYIFLVSTSRTLIGADLRMYDQCPSLYHCFHLLKCYPSFSTTVYTCWNATHPSEPGSSAVCVYICGVFLNTSICIKFLFPLNPDNFGSPLWHLVYVFPFMILCLLYRIWC